MYCCIQNGTDPLLWRLRVELSEGIAKGINFLHTGFEKALVHRDIKTSNILLDENFVPKVSIIS